MTLLDPHSYFDTDHPPHQSPLGSDACFQLSNLAIVSYRSGYYQ
jgi:hypothetical protein